MTEPPDADSKPDSLPAQIVADYLDSRQPARKGRALPMALPSDGVTAAAIVCGYIQTGEPDRRSAAVEAMHDRLASITTMADPASRAELGSQLAVLHALFLRLTTQALTAKPEHAPALLRSAMNAQSCYQRSLALCMGLEVQAKALGALNISHGAITHDGP